MDSRTNLRLLTLTVDEMAQITQYRITASEFYMFSWHPWQQ